MSGPRAAVSFLTPFGRATEPSASAFAWFPTVGAAMGALLGLLWWAAAHLWPAAVVAAIVVGADLGLTGLLHIDGLVDTADGLLPHLSRERRLAVMREPSIGAFGIAAGAAVLLARFAAIGSIHPSVLLLVGIWCGSRAVMAVAPSLLPYARGDGGLATSFLAPEGRGPAVVAAITGLGGLFGAAMAWRPLGGAVAALSGLVAASGVL
ncbi:MAG TPA: adenosylcobinamide-GDP ribazoletransferase, partial [Acidimicrobiales bacterium]|nr:adenosylcobinamide-GDP ribazoletransferase [Acidimicrobiales bacterium]